MGAAPQGAAQPVGELVGPLDQQAAGLVGHEEEPVAADLRAPHAREVDAVEDPAGAAQLAERLPQADQDVRSPDRGVIEVAGRVRGEPQVEPFAEQGQILPSRHRPQDLGEARQGVGHGHDVAALAGFDVGLVQDARMAEDVPLEEPAPRAVRRSEAVQGLLGEVGFVDPPGLGEQGARAQAGQAQRVGAAGGPGRLLPGEQPLQGRQGARGGGAVGGEAEQQVELAGREIDSHRRQVAGIEAGGDELAGGGDSFLEPLGPAQGEVEEEEHMAARGERGRGSPCRGGAARSTVSKETTGSERFPSRTSKSAAVSPWTGSPRRLVTSTGISTRVTAISEEAAPAGGVGAWAAAPPAVRNRTESEGQEPLGTEPRNDACAHTRLLAADGRRSSWLL